MIAGSTTFFDSSWQQPSNASIRFKRLDSQPPLVPVDYEIEVLKDAYRLVFLGPEGSSDFGLGLEKRGSLGATDCFDPQGYRIQISIPDVVKTSDFPMRICVKTSDKAGNFADPAAFDFGPPVLLPWAVRNAASLQRGGVVAPGSVFRVDTFNLTDVTEFSSTPLPMLAGVQMSVLDGAGQTLPVLMTTAGPLFTEGVMPDVAIPGLATVIVQPPQGPSLSQPVTIRRTAPGLYSENGIAVPSGFASDINGNVFSLATCLNQSCYTTHLPVSSTPGGLDFVLYCTGFRVSRGFVRLRIGTHALNDVEVHRHPNIAGVDELHFHIPQDFPLRLFQTILAETPDGDSNYLWIYLE